MAFIYYKKAKDTKQLETRNWVTNMFNLRHAALDDRQTACEKQSIYQATMSKQEIIGIRKTHTTFKCVNLTNSDNSNKQK